ncbi:unnamed protein product [Prorocentrum cordatum]|uniref:Uncharacterized protein n=1 Tax=Prorocentrum cordatum TaxID=2364126 RepID=A0ABN9WVL1_9DINO|nr:unnamed protein product [Polarella glacialis]
MLLAALLAVLWTYHAAAVEYFTLAATEVRAVSTDRPVLYSSNVDVVYRSAVRCTVTFDTPLHGFTAADIGAASTTVITGFSELSPNEYSFFVSSTVDANVSLSVAQGAARLWDPSVLGSIRYSDAEVPLLTFQFFRDPPSVSLRIDSQQGATRGSS